MTKKYIIYIKTETVINWRITWGSVTFFLPATQPYGDFLVENSWVYALGASLKKYMVYTSMGDSTTIIVMVYKNVWGSPKLNQDTIW